MATSRKLLEAVLSGRRDQNLRFGEVRKLVQALGFEERIKGDHHIYTRTDVVEILNFQPRPDGSAKPYQVRQLRRIITKYRLEFE